MAHGTAADPDAGAGGKASASPWAWGICWLLFACTVLNYMDRQAMAVVGPKVKAEFGLDTVGYGWLLAAFQLTYAFFQWPAGFLADRWPLRRTYAVAVAWWSLAGLATAFAPSLGLLVACRAMLGVGESFNWPCALRVTAGILPRSDRSLGNGIFNSGAAAGAVLTPLLVVPLAARMGWRMPFLILGAAGLVWVLVWHRVSRPTAGPEAPVLSRRPAPAEKPAGGLSTPARIALVTLSLISIGTAASAYWFGPAPLWWGVALFMLGLLVIARLLPAHLLEGAGWAASLGEIVRRRRFWIILLVGVTINVSWHFLVNWMAFFFQDERQLGLLLGGMVVALPFLTADVGNLAGGWAARRLTQQGWTPARSRMAVLIVCMALISSAVWVGWVQNDALIIALLCLTAMGAAAYMVNYFAFCQDVAPDHTGLVVGYLGGLGNLFAAGFLPLAGWIAETQGSFRLNFMVVGLLPLIGLIALLLGWGSEALDEPQADIST